MRERAARTGTVAQRDFRVWDQVPRGSRLYLRMEAAGAVLARARVTRSTEGGGVEEGHLSHVQRLKPPPPTVAEIVASHLPR